MDSKERLFHRLKGIKLLKNRAAESALRSVRRSAFLPPELEALGDCDAPLPCKCGDTGRFVPSVRFMALLLEALELTQGQRVAVIDSRGGYVAAAIAATIGRKGSVTAVEFDLSDEEAVLKNLERAGFSEAVEVMSLYAFMAKSSTYTRVLLLADELTPKDILPQVSELGFVVSRGGPEGLALARHVRSGDDFLEILFGDMRLIGPMAGPRGGEIAMDIDVSRVLGLEDIVSHVWTGKFTAEKEANVAELVKETFEDGPLDLVRHGGKDKQKMSAVKAFHAAYLYQTMGYLEDAEDLYKASLRIIPSAEAHTFLGWRLSFDGRYEEAIEECKRAIEVDSTLGNPYNDIGAYLIELGRLDEAVEWLQRALESERYCCYCYAHCNLGRVYLMKGMGQMAKRELDKALELNPRYDLARELLDRAEGEQDYIG
jgi:protein-L-isoaspartate O-methyltransferase/Flp pilus assembly protein TadD